MGQGNGAIPEMERKEEREAREWVPETRTKWAEVAELEAKRPFSLSSQAVLAQSPGG